MEFDFSKLRGRIVEKYGTYAAFATDIGLPASALSSRLNNQVMLGSDEITQWSAPDKLDIPAEEIHIFFLTLKVR